MAKKKKEPKKWFMTTSFVIDARDDGSQPNSTAQSCKNVAFIKCLTFDVGFFIISAMKKKSNLYYAVRTAVRFVFWSSVAAGALIGAIKFSEIGDPPRCNVTLSVDFTWNAKDFPNLNESTTLDECLHPDDVILSPDGTWDWVQDF